LAFLSAFTILVCTTGFVIISLFTLTKKLRSDSLATREQVINNVALHVIVVSITILLLWCCFVFLFYGKKNA